MAVVSTVDRNGLCKMFKDRYEVTFYIADGTTKVVILHASSLPAMFQQLIKKHPDLMDKYGAKLEWYLDTDR